MTEFELETMRRYVVEPITELFRYIKRLETYVLGRSEYEELQPERENAERVIAKMRAFFGEKRAAK